MVLPFESANKLLSGTFLLVREIEGKFLINFFYGRHELVQSIRSFEQLRVRKIGCKITVFDCSKSKGNVSWFEKSGFHCIISFLHLLGECSVA